MGPRAFLVACLFIAFTPSLAKAALAQVRVDAANVRHGPSTDDEIVAVLHRDDSATGSIDLLRGHEGTVLI